MIQVIIKLVHSFISFIYLIMSLCLFLGYVLLSSGGSVLWIVHSLFSYPCCSFFLELDLSSSSLLFISLVSLITSVVIIFSYSYIGVHYHSFMFIIILNLFVISIMFVISFKNLFVVMLGWDGLGVISFFLILYYQSPVSVFSAWFTILINRLGDGFLVLSIVLMIFSDLSSLSFSSYVNCLPFYLVLLLVLGFITNSAIYPFSPWLPVAMSAPTPISSLVHSSTLVTSGLYLIMRIDTFILSSVEICSVLMSLSLFTSLYAGLSALVETDLKKLVALSTLSHLGFIGMSFSIGYTTLAFFHLLAHALFNSLLFIGVGDWISLGHHYQDSRALSSGYIISPLSSLVIISSSFSLIGIPFIVGFYSNDIVLESLFYSSYSQVYLLVVYLNVFLTFIYTLRVVNYSLSSLLQPSPLFIVVHLSFHHFIILSFLSLVSLVFPIIYFFGFDSIVMCSIPLFHFMPLIILFISLFLLAYQISVFKAFSGSATSSFYILGYFSLTHILNIGSLYSSAISNLIITNILSVNNFFELGMFNSLSQLFFTSSSNLGLGVWKFSSVLLSILLLVYILMLNL